MQGFRGYDTNDEGRGFGIRCRREKNGASSMCLYTTLLHSFQLKLRVLKGKPYQRISRKEVGIQGDADDRYFWVSGVGEQQKDAFLTDSWIVPSTKAQHRVYM